METAEAPRWTPEMVCRRLVDAFAAKQRGRLAAEALTWPALYLPLDSQREHREYVLRWAQWKATGMSIREQTAARGWNRTTFRLKKDEACSIIARRLNELG